MPPKRTTKRVNAHILMQDVHDDEDEVEMPPPSQQPVHDHIDSYRFENNEVCIYCYDRTQNKYYVYPRKKTCSYFYYY